MVTMCIATFLVCILHGVYLAKRIILDLSLPVMLMVPTTCAK